MNLSMQTIGIPIAFVIFTSLLLWLIIWAKGHWFLKAGMVVLTFAFSFLMWTSINNLLGLPSEASLPDKFEVYWMEVQEPNKLTGSPGAIYIWSKDIALLDNEKLDEQAEPAHIKDAGFSDIVVPDFNPVTVKDEPKTYKLPYSRKMHKQAKAVQEMKKKGMRVQGTKEGMKGEGEGGEGKGKGKGKGKGRDGEKGEGGKGYPGSMSQQQEFVFHVLPPGKLPSKD